jgi:hypothetical protein
MSKGGDLSQLKILGVNIPAHLLEKVFKKYET